MLGNTSREIKEPKEGDIDKDEFADKCEWTNIQDVKFIPEHVEAIKLYLKLTK